MEKRYMLEAQMYIRDDTFVLNGIFKHVGYVNKIFRTKQDACDYYNEHNKHLRSLNAHGEWASGWDPETRLRYVVRRHERELMDLPPTFTS